MSKKLDRLISSLTEEDKERLGAIAMGLLSIKPRKGETISIPQAMQVGSMVAGLAYNDPIIKRRLARKKKR